MQVKEKLANRGDTLLLLQPGVGEEEKEEWRKLAPSTAVSPHGAKRPFAKRTAAGGHGGRKEFGGQARPCGDQQGCLGRLLLLLL
ncbi:UNVERIFIED_CONTAM: hypothetical protein K2H54_034029 [Gekko kuhli]